MLTCVMESLLLVVFLYLTECTEQMDLDYILTHVITLSVWVMSFLRMVSTELSLQVLLTLPSLVT